MLSDRKEQRVREIKACAETIIDSAETIVNAFEHNTFYDINIHIDANQAPELTITNGVLSEKMIRAITDE